MPRLTITAICLSYLACSANSGTARRTGGQRIRDSAGVQIVENAEPVLSTADAPRLSASPTFVIDHLPGTDVLRRSATAARMSDGRIVATDGESFRLSFFDGGGRFLNTVGGRTGGPSGVNRIMDLMVLTGDTIAATLSQSESVMLFDPRGAFVRQVDAPKAFAGPPGFDTVTLAVLRDQTFVVASLPEPRDQPGPAFWIDSMPLVAIGRDTTAPIRIGTFPMGPRVRHGNAQLIPWFSPALVFTRDAASLFVGYPAEYSIEVYSSDGRLERIIRRRWTPVAVTAADIDAFVTEWAKYRSWGTGPDAEEKRRDLREDPFANEVPAYCRFIADHAGRLWVQEPHLADTPPFRGFSAMPLVPSVWSVFDPGGRWLGDVTMPARFRPTDIGRDYVLGIAVDSNWVATVVQYRYGVNESG